MDAAGYLRKHGWRGTGHSLDASNHGLKKPLLISKKIDVLGIGINKHDVVADQWWMKAFDSSLKDFGTGKKSLLGQVKEHGVRRGGLYGRFVKGEGVPGTMGREVVRGEGGELVLGDGVAVGENEGKRGEKKKKRKADGDGDEKRVKKARKEDKALERAEKIARRAARKARKEGPSGVNTPVMAGTSASTSADESSSKNNKKKEKKPRKPETLETLSEEKKKQYRDRAQEKGVSLEEYFSRRQAKNLEAANTTFSEGENPWEGRETRDLTEEERKARRKWLRRRQAQQQTPTPTTTQEETSGNTSTTSASESRSASVSASSEDKVDEQEVLAQAILNQSRKKVNGEKNIKADILPNVDVRSTTGPFTEDEVKAARKAAKKTLKENEDKVKKSGKDQ